MKPEQLEALIRYRIDQAHETLREADILFAQSALRGTVNRSAPFIYQLTRVKESHAKAQRREIKKHFAALRLCVRLLFPKSVHYVQDSVKDANRSYYCLA